MTGKTSIIRRFAEDYRGNTAMIFGLVATVVMGLGGAALDYARAGQERQKIQEALDASALAGRKDSHLGVAQAQASAQAYWRANAPAHLRGQNISVSMVNNNRTLRATMSSAYQMPTSLLGVIGINSIAINSVSEATRGGEEVEIALVLDNTGSMVDDMNTLRRAARDLVTRVLDTGDGVRIGVVPYVAAVNPGPAALGMSMMDTGAESQHHAQFLRNRSIAKMTGCTWPWDRNPSPPPPPGPPPPPSPPRSPPPPPRPDTGGGQGVWNIDPSRSIAGLPAAVGRVFGEVLGVRSAQASGGEITPNTRLPLGGTWVNGTPAGRALLPTGFNFWNECGLYNPSRISHFDLFNRIPGAQWKGCVEARPSPHDVQDTIPSRSQPNTLFVPYFWIDEQNNLVNNYMDDGQVPQGWNQFTNHNWEATYNILKYNGVNRARTMNETAPNTSGPNMACPDPILPLTNDRTAILNKIDGLRHWMGGGTINSEGIMWGWRVLSPEAPFTEGGPWQRVRDRELNKIIVLMSDGQNSLGINHDRNSVTRSHYTSYGYLRHGRFGTERFDDATTFLNDRQRLACQNVRQTGIIVFTILFRERDPTARDLMRNCATEGRFYYEAITAGDLERAFADIAEYIGRLRISR